MAEPARQPFTFSGVAGYATARLFSCFAMSSLFAAIAAVVIGYLFHHCWSPVISEAVTALPPSAALEGGTLRWPEKEGRLLAASQFLALQVTVGPHLNDNPAADFGIALKQTHWRISSLLGVFALPYPEGWSFQIGATSLAPLWGAWRMPITFGVSAAAALILMLNWFVLALLYSMPARFVAWILGRALKGLDAWKLCVAAQWPGALLMIFALALYSTGEISLVFVLALFGAHFIPAFLYVIISPFFLPKNKVAKKTNPFHTGKPKSAANPFRKS